MGQTIEEYEREQAMYERAAERFEETERFDQLVGEWIDDLRDSKEYDEALEAFIEVHDRRI